MSYPALRNMALIIFAAVFLKASALAQADPCSKFTASAAAGGDRNAFTTVVPIVCNGGYFVFGVTNTNPDMQYTFYSKDDKGNKKKVQGPLDGTGGSVSVQLAVNSREDVEGKSFEVDYKLKDQFGCSLVGVVNQPDIAYGNLVDFRIIEQRGDSVRFGWNSITRLYADHINFKVSTSANPDAGPFDVRGSSGELTVGGLQPMTRYYIHAQLAAGGNTLKTSGSFCWQTLTFTTCAASDSTAEIIPKVATVNYGSTQQFKVNGGSNYQWMRNGNPIAGATDSLYAASVCGSYSVSLITDAGCKGFAHNSVLLNVIPPKPIVTKSASGFCKNESILLTASGPEGSLFEWRQIGSTYVPTSPSSYPVFYSSDTLKYVARTLLCSNAGLPSDTIVILPGVDRPFISGQGVFCQGTQINLSVPTKKDNQYTWLKDGVIAQGPTMGTGSDLSFSFPLYFAEQSGNYKIRVTRSGCDTFYEKSVDVKLKNLPFLDVTGLQANRVTNGTVSFRWDSVIAYSNSASYTDYYEYKVTMDPNPNNGFATQRPADSPRADSVKGLSANTNYYLHLRAHSSCVTGAWKTISFKTSSQCLDPQRVIMSADCPIGNYLFQPTGGPEYKWYAKYPTHTDSLYVTNLYTNNIDTNVPAVYGIIIKNGACVTKIDSVFNSADYHFTSDFPSAQVIPKDSCGYRLGYLLKATEKRAGYVVGWYKPNPDPFVNPFVAYGDSVYVSNANATYNVVYQNLAGYSNCASYGRGVHTTTQVIGMVPYLHLNDPAFPFYSGGSYCQGQTVELRVRSTPGDVVTWYKDNAVIQTGSDSLSFSFDNTKVATYNATIKNGCGTTFLSNAAIISAKKNSIDNLTQRFLTTNFAEFTWSPIPGGAYYEFAFTSSATPPASGTITYDTSASIGYLKDHTKYYLHVRGNTSCGATPWTTVSFTTLPICITRTLSLTASSATSICSGNSVVLSAPAGASYKWFRDGQVVTGSTQNYSATTGGKFKVEVQDSIGCKNITNEITVSVLPAPTLMITDPASACSSVNLTTPDITAGSGPALTYTYWKDTSAAQTLQNPSAVNITGTYYVKATSSNGCSTILPVHVSIVPLPTPVISTTGTTSVCSGDSVVLSSNSNVGNKWFLNGQDLNASGSRFVARASGNYTVQVTDRGCTSPISAPVAVQIKPLPATPVITAVGNTLSSSSPTGNQWYLNGSIIPGASSQQYQVQSAGIYTVRVTQNNCTSSSDQFNFIATAIVDPVLWNGEVNVYPNPVKDQLSVFNGKERKLVIAIIDITGKTLLKKTIKVRMANLNLQSLGKGTYLISITDVVKEQTVIKTIIKL